VRAGRTFVCIASGPSLTAADCKATEGAAEVIAVNDSWRLAPHADHLYACDARWWQTHGEQVVREFRGKRWTHQNLDCADKEQTDAAAKFGIELVVGKAGNGLGDPVMHFGDNSGYQAINLAYLWGANRIILLGYDMQRTGGKSHFFGDHPPGLNVGSDYSDWCRKFDKLADDLKAKGVEVINCSRDTALQCFPRMPLADVL